MFSLFTLAIVTAAAPEGGPIVVVQLSRGQELVYTGHCEMAGRGADVSTHRKWELTSRMFILATSDDKAEVALMTSVREPQQGNQSSVSARLLLTNVDYLGRFLDSSKPTTIPLDGPSALEPVAVLELPAKPMPVGTLWATNDVGRPTLTWTVIGVENSAGGTRCLKISGEQATSNWSEIGTSRAWRRNDMVWLDTRNGLVRRLERTIEVRDPTRAEVNTRLTTHYALESGVVYPDRLDAERRAEIAIASQIEKSVDEPIPQRTRNLDALERRLNHHVENHRATPYRDAVLAAGRKIDAVRRSDVQQVAASAVSSSEIVVGQSAPEFVATDVFSATPVRVGRASGRSTVLVFFRPDSGLAPAALRAASEVSAHALVVGLCVTDDIATARQLCRGHGSTLTLVDGREARARYALEATPRFVVIDSRGIVRLVIDGYGSEVRELLAKAVESEGCNR